MRAQLKSVTDLPSFRCDTLVIPVFKGEKLNHDGRSIDQASKRQISKLLAADEFGGKAGQVLALPLVSGTAASRIVLWGLGDKKKLNRQSWNKACDAIANSVTQLNGKHCAFISSIKLPKAVPGGWALQHLAARVTRSTYSYTATKPSKKANPAVVNKVSFINADATTANRQAIKQGVAIGKGINVARELGNLPGNYCTPKVLSAEARKLGRQHQAIKTTVLGEKQMEALGMGSLLSVGNGSDQESQLMIMNYQGGKKNQKPHVLVGKGITFDSGGISLKPGAKMDEMKFDMCGAASVFGTMNAIADMQLPLNVIGVVAAAENMPSGRATKPGDVVTSMAGKTIEVLNTDAEGRLVLCDALHYVKRFKPESVIDIATLTGAVIVALGHHATGLLSNDDDFAEELLQAGKDSADRAWHLPLWDDYQKQLDSQFADIANIGGPAAGTVTAGCFLSRFTEDLRWAHLDIAGTAWNQGGPKGASGRPVGLLCQYLMSLAGKAA